MSPSGPDGRPAAGAPDRARRPWYTRARIVLPGFAALLVLSALLTEEVVVGRSGDDRLTTFHTQPQGARLFLELAERLGWQIEQRVAPEPPGGTDVIHALLSVPSRLRAAEAHELLERVRAGAGLLLVLNPGSDALGDSLHVRVDGRDFYGRTVEAEPGVCPDSTSSFVPLWPDDRAHLYALRFTAPRPAGEMPVFVMLGAAPGASFADTVASLDPTRAPVGNRLRRDVPSEAVPAVVGFPLGRGRVVVASDPDFLRNDVLRECSYGLDVRAVRALEYLRDGDDGPRTRIVFDEYHQGFGRQPGTARAVLAYLVGTRSGNLLVQLLAAGLVLLAALAPRALPPRDPERVERRSPLEHVDALARAYAQVDGTRTVAAQLLRGVRRRLERGAFRAHPVRTDEAFLKKAEESVPSVAADVALVRRALREPLAARELERAGAALERIETSLKRS